MTIRTIVEQFQIETERQGKDAKLGECIDSGREVVSFVLRGDVLTNKFGRMVHDSLRLLVKRRPNWGDAPLAAF